MDQQHSARHRHVWVTTRAGIPWKAGAVGALIGTLASAGLTTVGWLGTLAVLIVTGLFHLARERSRRLTLSAAIESAKPGTLVLDRRRGRTLMVLKPFDTRP